ncbi:hypothetical protein [Sporichthya polymorpha]|uniref:hypothetical protein n=1 Tax=Sporichthya polymorpha TaxID=35751 RepID=UPI000379BE32|nr:hypothetical protein [Sporichthya polymorpha]
MTDTAADPAAPLACWCCGAEKPESHLLRLGARPEAAVCGECAIHLRQRARALGNRRAVARHLHNAANRFREAVISAGLHNRPGIGPALRWINRRSPF